ncbi:FtsX-like permease family protein [Actinoplanes sp. RD1]|uniref:FtsX-like permease family protein n=1 Tax=Actinoplanes sp. RD1 TaxID=3064538 RepID=UPI002740CC98|nr:ABC transporter permease [Actinoplanes sp. RD1]
MSVLRTQLAAVARRPSRLLLTGLAVLVASFVVYATVLARDITQKTLLDQASGTPAAAALVVGTNPAAYENVRVTGADYAKLKALPGVSGAEARVAASGQVGADYLSVEADPGAGPLAVSHLREGRFPARTGEIAVTPRTADRMGLPVGTTLTMTTEWTDDGKPRTTRKLTVTGIVDVPDDYGSAAYAPQPVVSALAGTTGFDQVELVLTPTADPAAVRAEAERIIAASPAPEEGFSRAQVLTGSDFRTAQARERIRDLDSIFLAVGLFVLIAVGAAGLVAASTFRIVFAQRMRQLALLRAIGAGRGAVRGALAAEGALTGLVTGVAGVLAALALGQLAPPLLRASGVELASPGFPVLPALGVVALAVAITVVAVLAPAFAAARVAPLEALRAAGTAPGRRTIGWFRAVAGILLALLGAALAAYVIASLPDRDALNYNPRNPLLATVASGGLIFGALMALGPVLIRPVLAAVGLPLRRLGPVGRLAVGGVGGAPRRAAAVATVVALGVTLIAGVVVTGASFREYAERELATTAPADFEIEATGDERLARDAVDAAAASPDLTHVTPYRRLPGVKVGDLEADAVDLDTRALPELAKVREASGSLTDVGPGKVAISGYLSDTSGLRAGDPATITAGSKKVQVQVAATLPESGPLRASVLMAPADLTKLGAPAGFSGLLADAAADGESGRTAGLRALKTITQDRPGFGTTVLADERDEINSTVDNLLAVVLGLIGLTVAIAVVGVGTTTALSVVERVRESGLLRAVGLSRTGLRTMMTTEAGLYGVVGAVLGLLLGVPYAWLAVKAFGIGAPLALPVWQLAAVLVTLAGLTALAGVLPARRAAKVSPVSALGVD